ncbi:uncharacterized protein FYW61_016594 [Anableps anableps]
MPSEAQEPLDRGPSHPLTRAGRSAQLAKAAATSPAPEKRSRGRPRKDGSHGCTAPPAPPPPSPKSRKKGRSRGRAQVEDEESTRTPEKRQLQKKTEPKEPQEPLEPKQPREPPEPKGPREPSGPKGPREPKEPQESPEPKEPQEPPEPKVPKKPVGRRRSISRRKSHTNPELDPEPSQARVSPCPEPEPEPKVPDCSSEPTPGSEEDRTRIGLVPAERLPEHIPGEDPQVCTSSPESGEPSHCPALMETSYSPSGVTMETEEGCGVGPVEQNPELSPRSSPPVSLSLEDEDEDSLSPLYQRSPSEDSGGSPTPSLGHAKKRLKQCAFCYRGDQPPLGQGRLVVFGPTPGYIPLHILNRRTSSDQVDDCHDHCYHGDPAPPTCSSPAQCEDESSSEFMKQLGPIGLPHDTNVQSLFDPTGQCCAHLQCAAWSEGVRQGDGQSLLYVDKAIDSGSSQVCGFCRRLGASLRCQEMGCGRSYHFPCAAAAGAHQDWNQRRTLCPRHARPGSSRCLTCSGSAEPGDLLMCCCCGNCYHGSCLDPALTPSPLVRPGWQCSNCRVCHSCRLRADDTALLVCQRCDKAYHTHCLSPPLDGAPSSSWTCKNCRVCCRCGVTSLGQWANHQFLCESCDPGLPCPLCYCAVDVFSAQESLTCSCCYRSVHTECSNQAGEVTVGSDLYVCSSCSPLQEDLISHSPTPVPPTHASLSLSPPHTEGLPTSPPAHSPGQLLCLEPAACQPSLQNLATSQPDLSGFQLSPKPSSTDHQISSIERQSIPGPSQKDLHLTAPQSPSYLKDSVAPSLEVLEKSPSLSPVELQASSSPSTKDLHQCHTSSPEQTDAHSSLTPAKYEQSVILSPSFDQCPGKSADETHESPSTPPVGTHPDPASPPAETHPGPASPPAETQQSPTTPPAETHPGPASPPAETHPGPASPPAETHQVPAETHHVSVKTHHISVETYESPATPPEETHQIPAETHHSSATPRAETHQIPVETHESPATPPAETHESPATPPAETHESPATPPAETHESPATPPAETHENP